MLNIYLSLLKKHHLSDTYKRRQLFSVIQKSNKPLPLVEIVTLAVSFMDRSNVYRSIDQFEHAEIVKKVYTGWKESIELSDTFSQHHHHITCTLCGKTENFFETEFLLSELKHIASKNHFNLQTHMLELTGICKNCKK